MANDYILELQQEAEKQTNKKREYFEKDSDVYTISNDPDFDQKCKDEELIANRY